MPERSHEPRARRGFLGLLGKAGLATVGAAAAVSATQNPAAADGNCNWTPVCCCLKTRKLCSGSGRNFTCPSGWTKRYWYCTLTYQTYGCGECQKGGTTCWNGSSYTCSTYWLHCNC